MTQAAKAEEMIRKNNTSMPPVTPEVVADQPLFDMAPSFRNVFNQRDALPFEPPKKDQKLSDVVNEPQKMHALSKHWP